ncbi:MAG: hypothetical protein ABUS47_02850 [Steroidobacter sp.]
MRKELALMMLIATGLFASNANAAPLYIYVPDMSQLQYQMTADGRVYFRNLNAYNNTVTGCCYAFYLDTTTPYGKSAWSLMMMKMATGAGLHLYVSNANPTDSNPATIDQVGNW